MKFAPGPCLAPWGEVPPEGRGRGVVQTVGGGMQFVSGGGAVGLSRGCGWNRCGQPSQALRASSPGGRAKGLVGVGRWREREGCGGCRGMEGEGRVRWVCREFVGEIGAVSPLRRFAPALPEGEPRAWWVSVDGGRGKGAVDLLGVCGWDRCGEPSQALRASSPGGRAKGWVGVGRRRGMQGCGGCR